MHRLTVT